MTTSSPVRAERGEARVAGDCSDTSFDQLSKNGVGSTPGSTADRWLTTLLIFLIRAWQIGPSAVLPPSCRYSPSCSAYAIEAVRRYGAARGGWLAIKRIARCHPWGGCGHDPVP